MSYITAPDPFPGRCKNYRSPGFGMETLRCLDYEGHDSRCQFGEPKPVMNPAYSQTYPQQGPEPWVSPLTEGDDTDA